MYVIPHYRAINSDCRNHRIAGTNETNPPCRRTWSRNHGLPHCRSFRECPHPFAFAGYWIPGRRAIRRRATGRTALKGKPGAFFTPDAARLITTGNFDDDLARIRDCDWISKRSRKTSPSSALFTTDSWHTARRDDCFHQHQRHSAAQIAQGYPQEFREHFLGVHFFNPPRYLHLVEMIPGPETSRRSGIPRGVLRSASG